MRSIDTATLVGIAFSVGSTSLAQVLLKLGMERPAVQAAMQHGGAIPFSRAVILEPQLLTGFLLYAAASIAWMLVELPPSERSNDYESLDQGRDD
ncbi:hypothetical protein ACWGK7_12295 [Sphingomonas aurantiaca]